MGLAHLALMDEPPLKQTVQRIVIILMSIESETIQVLLTKNSIALLARFAARIKMN